MKRSLLITFALAFCAATGFAQAQFQFTASPANGLISWSTDEINSTPFPVGNPSIVPAVGGRLNFDFFAAPDGTTLNLSGPAGVPNFAS